MSAERILNDQIEILSVDVYGDPEKESHTVTVACGEETHQVHFAFMSGREEVTIGNKNIYVIKENGGNIYLAKTLPTQ